MIRPLAESDVYIYEQNGRSNQLMSVNAGVFFSNAEVNKHCIIPHIQIVFRFNLV